MIQARPSPTNTGSQMLLRALSLLAAGVAMGFFQLPLQAQSPASRGEAVTFSRDIAPILQQNCQLCHQPGSIGPMSLMNFEQVRPWAPMIQAQVEARNMPPFHYGTGVGIQELKNDRRLSDDEISIIARWVEAGAPEGNRADLPPAVEWPDASEWGLAAELGQPDHVVRSAPANVPANGPDFWYRPLVSSNLPEDRCIRAIEVKPSVAGRSAVHHAIPTMRAQGGGGGNTLTEFALGKMGEMIPSDSCRIIRGNSDISWEIHYSPPGYELENDVVELGFWFYPVGEEPPYRQTLSLYFLERQGGGPVIDLPPNATALTQGFHSWNTPVRIDSFMPHGHYRLQSKWLELFNPNTRQRDFISIVPNFHPGWQNAYEYAEHVAPLVPRGSVMILTAFYNNTADNPHNPDPDQWVMRGARTTDEMSHAWIAVTHLDEEGYERLLAEREAEAQFRASAAVGTAEGP